MAASSSMTSTDVNSVINAVIGICTGYTGKSQEKGHIVLCKGIGAEVILNTK